MIGNQNGRWEIARASDSHASVCESDCGVDSQSTEWLPPENMYALDKQSHLLIPRPIAMTPCALQLPACTHVYRIHKWGTW